MEISAMLCIFILALVCEFIDSHLGGGYGTILSPLFLGIGISAVVYVPSILISEIVTGFIGGLSYHSFGKMDMKAAGLLSSVAGIGAVLGTLAFIKIPSTWLTWYIGGLVTILGALMIFNFKTNYKKKNVGLLGGLIGFNKALTGGGFGPIAVAGLSASGMEAKKSIGTTLMAEGVVCVISLILSSISGITIDFLFVIPLTLGAIIGAILGSHRTKKIKSANFSRTVGFFILGLGIFTICKKIILG